MSLFSSRAADNDKAANISLWLIALCCLPPILGVLSMANGVGWPKYLQGADIRPYYTGGSVVLHGEGARLYDLSTQWKWQHAAFPGVKTSGDLLPFLAPPFVAAPMALLANFSVRTAFLVWLAINWVLLTIMTHRFARLMGAFGQKVQVVTIVLCVTCAPVCITLLQGQWALVLTISLLSSWLDLREGRDFRGGLWLSVLLFKPQLLLLPLLILAWKKRAASLLGFGAGALILLAISLCLIGIEGLKSYAHLLKIAATWNHQYGVVPEAMYTWRGLLRNFTDKPNPLWWAGAAPLIGVLLWCWRGAWPLKNSSTSTRCDETRCDEEAARFDALWAMTILAALFCSPYLYYHDLTLLLVPTLLLAFSARGEALRNRRSLGLMLPVFGFMLFWVEFFFVGNPLGTVAPNVFYTTLCFVVLTFFLKKMPLFRHDNTETTLASL